MYACLEKEAGLERNYRLAIELHGPPRRTPSVDIYGEAFLFKSEADSMGSGESTPVRYVKEYDLHDDGMLFPEVEKLVMDSLMDVVRSIVGARDGKESK